MFVLALGLAGPVWADGPVDEAGALVFYEKGIALEGEGKWAKAEEQFVESLKRHERPRTAAHLGRVQVEQGKFVEGATNMEWFFREDTEVPLDKKELGRQPLVVALSNVGTLKLNIEPIDAVITIDGAVVPTNRRAWPQYVTPKLPHTVEVKKEGFVTKSETWTLAAGTEKLVKITLEPARVDAVSEKGKVVGPSAGSRSLNPWWIGGGVAGVAFVGAGIGAWMTYSWAAAGFDAHKKWETSGQCDSQCARDFAQYEKYSGPASGLTAAAIATALAGTGIFIYISVTGQPIFVSKRSQEKAGLQVMPGVQGFTIRGRF